MSIPSPITGKSNTRLVKQLRKSVIANAYRDTHGIDVERFLQHGPDDDYLRVYECADTGYRFFWPSQVQGDQQFYEQLLTSEPQYYASWKHDYQLALDRVRLNGATGAVLDIGCGVGNFIGELPDEMDPTGLEFNSIARQAARDKGLNVLPDSVQEHARQHAGHYDFVCAFQILEHVYDVRGFVNACVKLLKPGGELIVSVPNNTPFYAGQHYYSVANTPPHHVGLWNADSLQKLAEHMPLSVNAVRRYGPVPLWRACAMSSVSVARQWRGTRTATVSGYGALAGALLFYGLPRLVLGWIRAERCHSRVMVVYEKA